MLGLPRRSAAEALYPHTAAGLEWEGHPTLIIEFNAVLWRRNRAGNGSGETMTSVQGFTGMVAQVGLSGSRWWSAPTGKDDRVIKTRQWH